MMMSITQAQNLAVNKKPVYNTKPVYLYRGEDLVVHKTEPFGRVSPGYLGRVIGFNTYDGKIYLRIDDENVYNDGINFLVYADDSALVTSESDAPKTEPGIFESIGNTLSDVASWGGKTIFKAGLWIAGAFLVYKLVENKLEEETKEGIKKGVKSLKSKTAEVLNKKKLI